MTTSDAKPVEVTSVAQWNSTLRDSTAKSKTVFVDFHAVWCGPCKQIAPIYESLAAQYGSQAEFLRVDVDQQRPISTKYQISAMPTFIVIQQGKEVDRLKGADPQGLRSMVSKHWKMAAPPLPAGAETAKSLGNDFFKQEKWQEAITQYTQSLELAPDSAVLLANRSAAYLKAGQVSNALDDGRAATEKDPSFAKAHYRHAQALEADFLASGTASRAAVVDAYTKASALFPPGRSRDDCAARLEKLPATP